MKCEMCFNNHNYLNIPIQELAKKKSERNISHNSQITMPIVYILYKSQL